MGKNKRAKKGLLLCRPKSITSRQSSSITKPKSLKPKNTRKIIRRFHVLLKDKSKLETQLQNVDSRVRSNIAKHLKKIDQDIEELGGLELYQAASVQGQNSHRGGDSSKQLVSWMKELLGSFEERRRSHLRALEIGCLSTKNEISRCGVFDMDRIDLHSQEPGIEEQDFMEMKVPSVSNRYDLISCSLVLNFVSEAAQRGEMLRRATRFLKEPESISDNSPFPGFFLVLPLPCVSNSRYFDHTRLVEMMESIGFALVRSYVAKKLQYWLWRWKGSAFIQRKVFKKEMVNPGSNRNNFCIVFE